MNFIYWHENLTSADSQQVLFAMVWPGQYERLYGRIARRGNWI